MRKIQVDAFGGLDVLHIVEAPDPSPAAGNVTIDVTHIGLGLVDALLRGGMLPLPLPFVPGLEVSGHIARVGDGVAGFKPGDAVTAMTLMDFGAYATVVNVSASRVISLEGSGVDLPTAAAAIVNFTTAHVILTQIAPVGPESRLLVHGASGGLGTACVQLARTLGVTRIVASTSSPAKRDYLKGIGATAVLDVHDLEGGLDERVSSGGFDVIIDPVGGDARRQSIELLAHRGRLLVVGGADRGDEVQLPFSTVWFNNIEVIGVNIGGMQQANPERIAASGREVVRLLGEGRLDVGAIDILPFEQVAEAHRRLEGKEVRGKLLLAV